MRGSRRLDLDAASGRNVSSGSVFSTILLHHTLHGCAQRVTVDRSAERKVLDVGSGESPYRDLLSPTTYVGIDRQPFPRPGDLALVADAMAMPLRDAYFDGVLCTEVIEHVKDERELVGELARVSKAGAQLVLSSPFVNGLHEMPNDFRRLTSIGLVTLLDEAGWQVESVTSVGGPFIVAVDSFARWATRRTRALANRLSRPGAIPHRLLLAAAAGGQKLLARIALGSRSASFGVIDPYVCNPRLTLGYVVVATRRGD